MAAVRFPKPEVVFYLSRGLRYLMKIFHGNGFPLSQRDAVTKPEAGSRFPTVWPPS